jgi:hypothetical protein
LMQCCWDGEREVVAFLLENSADVNITNHVSDVLNMRDIECFTYGRTDIQQ